MRANVASGMVPSTMLGRMRCDKADEKAPSCPDSRLSISMKPVTGSK